MERPGHPQEEAGGSNPLSSTISQKDTHVLDRVIILNERHLKRLMSSYLLYYHEDRTHLGLAKDTPASRPTEIRSARERKIQSFSRLGGLHNRYAVAA